MNSVILSGRAVRESEVRNVGQYTVAKFTIAVNRPFAKNKESDFFKVEAWGKLAEKAAKVVKGIKVCVSGYAKLASWPDKTTGQKRYETQIVANELEIIWGAESNYSPAMPMADEQIPEAMLNGTVDNSDQQTEVPF